MNRDIAAISWNDLPLKECYSGPVPEEWHEEPTST